MAASEGITRRSFVKRGGVLVGAAALTPLLPERVLFRFGGRQWLAAAYASPGVVLNPADPSNFTQDGAQTFTRGTVLTLQDASFGDFIAFFAADVHANPGTDVDIVATFQVLSSVPVGADAGNRVAINDGQTRSAIAACCRIPSGGSSANGIGLLSQGEASDAASYPVFLPVDWTAAPVTLRLRRWANGDAELVELNGVAPSPRALLTADKAPGPIRAGFGSVEFGSNSAPQVTVAYSAFRSEHAAIDASLTITHIGALAGRNGDAAAGVTFTDADPQGGLSQYTGTIDWGDATPPSRAQFARNPFGGFAAGGVHRYTSSGSYTVTFTITDSCGASASRSTTLIVPTPRTRTSTTWSSG